MTMQKLIIAACLLLAPLAAVRPRATAPLPLKLRGGAAAPPPQPPQPPPPPQRRRPPREAVAARLLATGSGRRAALTGFEMLDLLDTYAPPLACASRYGWQRLCADVLAPYWVAGADRRDVRRAFQRRAADPRSQEFQARHRYYGLAPAEADAFLDKPFDKYASVSDAFLRREGLGRYAAAAASSKDVDSIFGGKALKAERGSLRRAAMRRDAGDDGAAWDEDEDDEGRGGGRGRRGRRRRRGGGGRLGRRRRIRRGRGRGLRRRGRGLGGGSRRGRRRHCC